MCTYCSDKGSLEFYSSADATAVNFKPIVTLPEPKYDWEVLMQTIDPRAFLCGVSPELRPRRWSINALADVVGRDPKVILKEMQKSEKVLGYWCPDVNCCVFYMIYLRARMIDTSDSKPNGKGVAIKDQAVWDTVKADLKKFAKGVRGFRRFDDKKPFLDRAFDPEDKGDTQYEGLCMTALETWRAKQL